MWVQQPLVPHEGVVLVGIQSIFMCRIFLATIYPSDKKNPNLIVSQTLENNFEQKNDQSREHPLDFCFQSHPYCFTLKYFERRENYSSEVIQILYPLPFKLVVSLK
jgi:hypothetical protein